MAHKIAHVQIRGILCFQHNVSAKLLKPPSIFLLAVQNQGPKDKKGGKTFEEPIIFLQIQLKASTQTKVFPLVGNLPVLAVGNRNETFSLLLLALTVNAATF